MVKQKTRTRRYKDFLVIFPFFLSNPVTQLKPSPTKLAGEFYDEPIGAPSSEPPSQYKYFGKVEKTTTLTEEFGLAGSQAHWGLNY
jgi:hypothetical protein